MAQPTLSDGTVELVLGETTYHLAATMNACLKLSAMGGVMKAWEAVTALDLQAMAALVAVGAELDDREAMKLPERIFKAGIVEVRPKLQTYVMLLSNGGRLPSPEDDEPSGEIVAGGVAEDRAGNA